MIIDLKGRKAIVTGSTAGIGRAIAEGLARAGEETYQTTGTHGYRQADGVGANWSSAQELGARW